MEQKQELVQKHNFSIQDMLPIGLTLVVLGIGIAYGLNVMEDVQSDFTANTSGYNATADAIDGVAKLPEKLPLIVTVIVAAIIIGILVRYLMVKYA